MPPRTLQFNPDSPFRRLVGVGGIGTGLFFALEGQHTLGRNESRPARLLNIRDYCKLHIISHYIAILLGAKPAAPVSCRPCRQGRRRRGWPSDDSRNGGCRHGHSIR